MNTVLGDALRDALVNKKTDYSTFVWKGEKIKKGKKYVQQTEQIDEMTPERLKECWNHCKIMLHNNDPKHLGRYNVLEEITSQINKCNAELFLRYLEGSYMMRTVGGTPRFSMMLAIREFIKNSEAEAESKGIVLNWDEISVIHLSGEELPSEFQDVSIASALDACTDNLGTLNKQHLTMSFITKMGLWFTKAEEIEFKANSNIERVKLAKEKLHLPKELILKFSEKGLSYHEMRAILILPKKQKYSDMTTEQLVTLRNKVLLRLSRQVDSHIYSWKQLQKQIEIVARSKGINLNDID